MKVRIVEKAEKTVGDEISSQMDKGKEHDQAVAIALSKKEKGEINEMVPVLDDSQIIDRFRATINTSGRDMGHVLNLFMDAWNGIKNDLYRKPDDIMNKE